MYLSTVIFFSPLSLPCREQIRYARIERERERVLFAWRHGSRCHESPSQVNHPKLESDAARATTTKQTNQIPQRPRPYRNKTTSLPNIQSPIPSFYSDATPKTPLGPFWHYRRLTLAAQSVKPLSHSLARSQPSNLRTFFAATKNAPDREPNPALLWLRMICQRWSSTNLLRSRPRSRAEPCLSTSTSTSHLSPPETLLRGLQALLTLPQAAEAAPLSSTSMRRRRARPTAMNVSSR